VAIDVIGLPDSIHVGDTVVLHIRVLNRSGDSIPNAPVELISLNPDTLGVDNSKQAIVGILTGPGRAIARSGDLPSEPFTVPIK
jgi:hypothetical protein